MAWFWTIAGLAAAAAGVIVARAAATARPPRRATQSDIAVYRDQMAEVDRDVARGVLAENEAGSARSEIGRRLLEADRRARGESGGGRGGESGGGRGGRTFTMALMAFLTFGPFAAYSYLGAPGTRDLPIQRRIEMLNEAAKQRPTQREMEAEVPAGANPDTDPEYAALVERLRGILANKPDDARGFDLLATAESRLGNAKAAYAAKLRAIEIKGDAAAPNDFAAAGGLMIQAAGGRVSPEAFELLTRGWRGGNRSPSLAYHLGLHHLQIGRYDIAFNFWRRLIESGPPDAPWVSRVRASLPEIAALAGAPYSPPPETTPRSPSMEDIEAAAAMTSAERREMIEGMVAGLANRLATEGGPADEWARLIRALAVLDRVEEAASIVSEARRTFADDAIGLALIAAAAAALDPPQ